MARTQLTRITPLAERFARFVNRDGPIHPTLGTACWLWTGSTIGSSHGQISRGRREGPLVASRVAWTLANGPIPDGLFVLHRCDNINGPCVNVAHLFLGTQADNVQDMVNKRRIRHGEQHKNAKLTVADVRAIRAVPRTYGSGRRLAKRYGVSEIVISNVRLGVTWRLV